MDPLRPGNPEDLPRPPRVRVFITHAHSTPVYQTEARAGGFKSAVVSFAAGENPGDYDFRQTISIRVAAISFQREENAASE